MLDLNLCNGCHACFNTCPKNAIEMKVNSEGFLYPEINSSLCINCGLCEKFCSLNRVEPVCNVTAYACINKDNEIKINSSSGGVFTLLAEEVLNQNGVVFGAAFIDNFSAVKHIYIENSKDIYKLRGSKYVQSEIGHSFKIAKDFLNNGRYVLFTGTPCQIGGFKKYLGKEYENLITQDFICHGVPSPLVWRKYLAGVEKKYGSCAEKIFFRNKKYGWKNYSLYIQFPDNEYFGQMNKDPFLRGFIRNVFLRTSCYNCKYKTIERNSDITLADFWGIESLIPDFYDNQGTSLILTHTVKGENIFEKISPNVTFEKVAIESAIKSNSAITHSASPFSKREDFFNDLIKNNSIKVIKKYCTSNILQKISKIPAILKSYMR